MMSDDEDNEELPMIFFNSSAPDESRFSMPSAEQVAGRRARERACELQLQELRARHAAHDAALARADSSGSEGEASLAAAVHELRVAAPPPRAPPPAAAALLAALAPALPPRPRKLLEHPDTATRLPELVSGVCALVSGGDALDDADALAAGALLATSLLAPHARGRAATRRALHALLDYCTSPAQAAELSRVLVASFPCARVRLELSDALRSGAGAGADVAAASVRDAALAAALDVAPAGAGAGLESLASAAPRWRRLPPAERYTQLQLLGRRLAAAPRGAEREARTRLLAALAPAAREHAAGPQGSDQLKVLVGAARLRLLFGADT